MHSFTLLRAAVAAVVYSSIVYAVEIDTEGLPDSGLDTSSWSAGVKPPLADIFNLHDMQIGVKNYLGKREYCMLISTSVVA